MPREPYLRMICLGLLAWARVTVPVFGLIRVRAMQAAMVRAVKGRGGKARRLEDLLEMTRVCSLTVPGANCLSRALAGQILATAYGYEVTLRIGVRANPRVEGHAWLEQAGKPCLAADSAGAYLPMELSIKP